MKQIFFSLSIFFLFTGCQKTESLPKASAEKEISKKINELYSTYGTSNDALYHKSFSDSLFSPELKRTLEETVKISNADIEKVKKSDHPTDKPWILEGSVFTSLYEGSTNYKIKTIKPTDTMADVTVDLENKNYRTKWTDTVHLVNAPNSGWRIDNIKFDTISQNKDLRTVLKDFISKAKNAN